MLSILQEKWQRETLQHTLELKSSGDNAEVQRAFATALEMQHKSAEEAAALKAELAQTTRKSQEDINALAEQVGPLVIAPNVYDITFLVNIWRSYRKR